MKIEKWNDIPSLHVEYIIESKWKRATSTKKVKPSKKTRCRRGASIMARLQVVYKRLETRRCRPSGLAEARLIRCRWQSGEEEGRTGGVACLRALLRAKRRGVTWFHGPINFEILTTLPTTGRCVPPSSRWQWLRDKAIDSVARPPSSPPPLPFDGENWTLD